MHFSVQPPLRCTALKGYTFKKKPGNLKINGETDSGRRSLVVLLPSPGEKTSLILFQVQRTTLLATKVEALPLSKTQYLITHTTCSKIFIGKGCRDFNRCELRHMRHGTPPWIKTTDILFFAESWLNLRQSSASSFISLTVVSGRCCGDYSITPPFSSPRGHLPFGNEGVHVPALHTCFQVLL